MGKRPKMIDAGSDAASAALRSQAREAGSAAMAALVKLATGESADSVKLAAIKELLDRGFGRAAQTEAGGTVIAHLVIDDGYPG